ncbi:P-loop containing nucleoside triphosphate hydrolase protein [Xylaria arbuscula]|nr:P-loop containing nucleoside triphosphate hydrolase protein [Xylaria arbuscula]
MSTIPGGSYVEYGHRLLNASIDNKHHETSHASTRAKSLRILIVGVTGSGKSTLITSALGRDVGVGHGVESYTQTCNVYPIQLGGTQFELIDTPGFDDPRRDDFEVLRDISEFLNDVAGIIYCHRINETKLIGNSRLNLDIIKAMCGKRFYSRIVVCSTMWDAFPQNLTQQKVEGHRERMEELLGTGLRDLMDKGARYMEFHADQRDPCLNILRSFSYLRFAPKMEIMEQLSERLSIPETNPGLVIEENRKKPMEGRPQEQASAKNRKQQRENNYNGQDPSHREGSSLKKSLRNVKWIPLGS